MKRMWLGAGAALLLGGCASVEMAQYTVTSFAEVPLKEKAKVKGWAALFMQKVGNKA